jgi:hypothetical protein
MYDRAVHQLDLCVLAYHLHAQALRWPMDRFSEEMVAPAHIAARSSWPVPAADSANSESLTGDPELQLEDLGALAGPLQSNESPPPTAA